MGRTIAIGDIHGGAVALSALLDAVGPTADDTIVTLGDYVDRGPDSRGVIDQLIALSRRSRLVPLRGNHEEMMLQAADDRSSFIGWLACGGDATLDSYGTGRTFDLVPAAHVSFIEGCRSFFQSGAHVFVHAGYEPDVPLDEQDGFTLRWRSLRDGIPDRPLAAGKVVVVGHTPVEDVLDVGHLIGLDTGLAYGGWLSALDVGSGTLWQVDERGTVRDD